MRYVFVCMGNTCRSPMAEAIMNGELKKRRITNAYAESCGVMAYEGASANEYAKEAVKKYGFSLDNHSARRINAAIVTNAVVLCMEKQLTDYVRKLFPGEKVFDLCDFTSVSGEISDPYGMGQETYDACAEKIKRCIWIILDKKESAV